MGKPVPTDGRRAVFTQALLRARAAKADAEKQIAAFEAALKDLDEVSDAQG